MHKEPESARAKVVKPALQGQVSAGCSTLSDQTSLCSPRGQPGGENGAFHPKAVGDKEFKINCKGSLQYILFLIADSIEIILVWFRNYIKSWPRFDTKFKSQSAPGQFAAPWLNYLASLSLSFLLFHTLEVRNQNFSFTRFLICTCSIFLTECPTTPQCLPHLRAF